MHCANELLADSNIWKCVGDGFHDTSLVLLVLKCVWGEPIGKDEKRSDVCINDEVEISRKEKKSEKIKPP